MYASIQGYFEIAKLLVENGADPNVKNMGGRTALRLASEWRNFRIAVYLVEHFAEMRPWRSLLDVATIKERINEINEIRKVIETILFPCDDPFIARIISEFTDGLENLKEFN
jgi:ankyrin repeat protein